MEPVIRNEVRQRAGNRCEYCRLRQEDEEENPFHIEHIIAQQHGGTDSLETSPSPAPGAMRSKARIFPASIPTQGS